MRARKAVALGSVALLSVVFVAANAYAGATGNKALGEFLLDASFVPVAAVSFVFGVRGAIVSSVSAAAFASILFWFGGLFTAEVYATDVVLFGVVAGIVGWAVDRVRSQAYVFARRHELSLELLATLKNGMFVSANPVWERLLGHPAAGLLGAPFLDLIHEDDRDQILRARERLTSGEPVTGHVSRIRRADGEYVWIEWSVRQDQRDRVNYVAGRDVTLRRKAEQALARHNQLLEEAVAARTAALEQRTVELEQLARELDGARRDNLRHLAIASEFHDDKTAEHTERVGETAALLAHELGLPDHDVQLLREAAPLHDIGKIGIPDAILLKPDALTDAERKEMQLHTELGAQILSSGHHPTLQLAATIALHHHEWWDGGGYPHGLAGERIPLPARIVAVADVLDALTHQRPYKQRVTREEAVQIIDQLSGRQFDPTVVGALHRIHDRRPARTRAQKPSRAPHLAATLPALELESIR